MNKNKNVRLHWLLLICFTAFYFFGCATSKRPVEKLIIDQTITIIPFINYSGELIPENNTPKADGQIASRPVEDLLTDALVSRLKQKGLKNISVLPRLSRSEGREFSLTSIQKEIAGRADVVIVGRLFRFKERRGSRYAASAPASVSFDIRVVRTVDGKMIHQYEYNETQAPLFENLLNLKKFVIRKGRWVKAIELACYGLDESIKNITY